MAFDWSDIYEIARILGDGDFEDKREAALRTALSRAYYAAFNWSKEWCQSQGCSFYGNSGDHEKVRIDLRALHHEEFADYLFVMHQWRKQADYDKRFHGSLKAAWYGASNGARQIIETLR